MQKRSRESPKRYIYPLLGAAGKKHMLDNTQVYLYAGQRNSNSELRCRSLAPREVNIPNPEHCQGLLSWPESQTTAGVIGRKTCGILRQTEFEKRSRKDGKDRDTRFRARRSVTLSRFETT